MPAPPPILRVLQRIGRTRAAAAAGRRLVPALDGLADRASRGRLRVSDLLFPTLILEHVGRRSGRRHRTPLAYVLVDGAYVLAATNFGRARHPAWSHNLRAATQAAVVLKGERVRVSVALAPPDEKARVWPKLLRIWPGFADYGDRSGREIRVFVLRPLAGGSASSAKPA